MTEQSGSMQFSGDLGQSRSPSSSQPLSQSSHPAALAQGWNQPARMLSQMSSAFGQMPVRMLEQEASMLQRSFAAPQSWFPGLFTAWEEPMVMMRKLSEEMDQYFGKLIQGPLGQTRAAGTLTQHWTPSVEIAQRGNEIVICADLPGLTRNDVKLQLFEDRLTIEGERTVESKHQDAQGYHRTERSYGRFFRTIPLPEGVDAQAAQASMRDGVLEIVVPLLHRQQQGVRLDIREAAEGQLREQKSELKNEPGQRREGAAAQSPAAPQRQAGNAPVRAEVKA